MDAGWQRQCNGRQNRKGGEGGECPKKLIGKTQKEREKEGFMRSLMFALEKRHLLGQISEPLF